MTQPIIQEMDLKKIPDMTFRELFRAILGKPAPPKRVRKLQKPKQLTLPGIDLSKTKRPLNITRVGATPTGRYINSPRANNPYKGIEDYIRKNPQIFNKRNEISLEELTDVVREIVDEETTNEGVGYVTDKDMAKDPKHIKGERWRIKFQSEKDLGKHGTTEKSPVNENFGEQAGKTPDDPMQIVDLIMKSGNVLFFTGAGIRGPVIRTTIPSGIYNRAQADIRVYVDDNKKQKRVLTRNSQVEELANSIIQQKMSRYFVDNKPTIQKTPGANPITEVVTPKTQAFIEKSVAEKGTRQTAKKLIDVILSNSLMGLTSEDLPDTSTFANGLDGIETALREGDYKGAIRIAAETAKEMVEEEGGEGIMNENTVTKTQLKGMIKKLVNEMWIGFEQEEGMGDKKRVDPKDMVQALKFLNKVNPAAYAQLMVLPFGPVPSYAWEDPNSEWWSSEQAFAMRQSIKDAQREGPKPGKPMHQPTGAKYSWQTAADDIKE